mmetsp:Transcript_30741/g.98173  ORF Transcript_30741/g.98173 Transcript_30741/m.98173 type:complete len:277 (+) Transcript_30741:706-1536(+)
MDPRRLDLNTPDCHPCDSDSESRPGRGEVLHRLVYDQLCCPIPVEHSSIPVVISIYNVPEYPGAPTIEFRKVPRETRRPHQQPWSSSIEMLEQILRAGGENRADCNGCSKAPRFVVSIDPKSRGPRRLALQIVVPANGPVPPTSAWRAHKKPMNTRTRLPGIAKSECGAKERGRQISRSLDAESRLDGKSYAQLDGHRPYVDPPSIGRRKANGDRQQDISCAWLSGLPWIRDCNRRNLAALTQRAQALPRRQSNPVGLRPLGSAGGGNCSGQAPAS